MADTTKVPAAPAGLGARSRAFWEGVNTDFELGRDERELLVEVCRLLDLCESLRCTVEVDGTMSVGSHGQPVAHPALSHLNQARVTLGRLLAQLGLPQPESEPIQTPRQVRGRNAANHRWSAQRAIRGA